jgi:pantoate--beta-alanine ligase
VEVVSAPAEMQRLAEAARRQGSRIALVATMGFLHEGHLALMREARRRASLLVVSIFVNPTQFGPSEDLTRYPRDLAGDVAKIREVPADLVFAPDSADIFVPGAQTWVEVSELTRGLCGAHRPGHFRGVTTIVAKLFNLVRPHLAIFGEKDFQQLRAIQQMVRDLNFDVEIVSFPIVRESDGLAMSSRNAYLSADQRRDALALSRALFAARDRAAAGLCDPQALRAIAAEVIASYPRVELEYLEAVDAETLSAPPQAGRPLLLAVAARVGNTRLIDNLVLGRRD